MEKEKIRSVAQELLNELLSILEISVDSNVELVEQEGEYILNISIPESNESGLLIGTRGSTLNAIQSFMALALKQKTGEWIRVVLDIGDWRTKHEEYLKNLAAQASERARNTGQDQHLYNLSPSQRRTIHMFLSEEKGIVTESQGEGAARYLVVKATPSA